jgi:hypothetical protein
MSNAESSTDMNNMWSPYTERRRDAPLSLRVNQ